MLTIIIDKINNRIGRIYNSILLEKQLKQTDKQLKNIDIEEIRKKTLEFIEKMRMKEKPCCLYRYSESTNTPVLYASIYAVLTRHLYNDLDLTEKQRKDWISYIQSFQDHDGLFKDPNIKNEISDDSDWWGWRHLTLHAIMALTCLDAIPKKRFKIIEPFKNTDYIIKWLKERDWIIDPANTSNIVQNYFTLLQYARDFMGESWADRSLKIAYSWLNENQDPNTGLWGAKFNTPILLSNGVQTGYYIWLLYFYDNRSINYIEKIIDSCLKTQNKYGGFGVPYNSSACEDIDSIDPLVRLSLITDYRREEVILSLERAVSWIFTNMNEDGGFVFRRYEPFIYGHKLMSSKRNESAMFPTWFRTLSIAYIGKYFESLKYDHFLVQYNWNFIKCPGLQFWNF